MNNKYYGYRIVDGSASVSDDEADRIRMLYKLVADGMCYSEAGKVAGIPLSRTSLQYLLRNPRYIGDDFYPAIVDKKLFDVIQAEIHRRYMKSADRENKRHINSEVPVQFSIREQEKVFTDPIERAEYIYSLIDIEEE